MIAIDSATPGWVVLAPGGPDLPTRGPVPLGEPWRGVPYPWRGVSGPKLVDMYPQSAGNVQVGLGLLHGALK